MTTSMTNRGRVSLLYLWAREAAALYFQPLVWLIRTFDESLLDWDFRNKLVFSQVLAAVAAVLFGIQFLIPHDPVPQVLEPVIVGRRALVNPPESESELLRERIRERLLHEQIILESHKRSSESRSSDSLLQRYLLERQGWSGLMYSVRPPGEPYDHRSGQRFHLQEDFNVRSGPGMGYSVLRILPQGSTITVTPADNRGWARLLYAVDEKSVVHWSFQNDSVGYVYRRSHWVTR